MTLHVSAVMTAVGNGRSRDDRGSRGEAGRMFATGLSWRRQHEAEAELEGEAADRTAVRSMPYSASARQVTLIFNVFGRRRRNLGKLCATHTKRKARRRPLSGTDDGQRFRSKRTTSGASRKRLWHCQSLAACQSACRRSYRPTPAKGRPRKA